MPPAGGIGLLDIRPILAGRDCRAPARAQDLTLRHRVRDDRAGDLERRHPRLAVEEDFFVNDGFVQRGLHALMHPHTARTAWPGPRWAQAHAVPALFRELGVVHRREVDADAVLGALARAKARLPSTTVDGQRWFWPAGENPASKRHAPDETVRLLAPFDPVVWDRRRLEAFWGWPYRFEAYTPAAKRKLGYYALRLLWRDPVIGWGNLAWRDGRLDADFDYVTGRAPRDATFRAALDDELRRLAGFQRADRPARCARTVRPGARAPGRTASAGAAARRAPLPRRAARR